jgi:DNA transposition AAA+ family ATPase
VIAEVLESPRVEEASRLSPSEPVPKEKGDGIFRLPLNLEKIQSEVPPQFHADLTWFHQHALDAGLTWNQMAEALNYDRSTIHRVVMCIYTGSWDNVTQRIRSYKKIVQERGTIQTSSFRENSISRKISAGLSYALANNSITLIVGCSGIGKSAGTTAWCEKNNHGRSRFVEVPPIGGPRALIKEIAIANGVNRGGSSYDMLAGIYRAFNENRILILDEVLRLLPVHGGNPTACEVIRSIHDKTKCGLALLATARFPSELTRMSYQYEQLLGRIGMPIWLSDKVKESDMLDILTQYIAKPSRGLIEDCLLYANEEGRLRNLVQSLQLASRVANKAREKLSELHVRQAINLRKENARKPRE